MHRLLIICMVIFIGSSCSESSLLIKPNPNDELTSEQIIKKYGYPFENHTVETSDGYLLTLHRIPYGVKDNNTEKARPTVLIMHGLLSSSADFVNKGPAEAISFLLADTGYDVWLGNQRGNTWSRKHIDIDPDKESAKFFNFSFHEIGTLDLPAEIDYILATTKQDNLFYIGHSQGTTTIFILLSTRPEYNNKIKMAINLAPIAYVRYSVSFVFKVLSYNYNLIIKLLPIFNLYEILPHHSFTARLIHDVCSIPLFREACALGFFVLAGFDSPELDRNFLPVITSNCPAGASIKQLLHYTQIYNSNRFMYYDYGTKGNVETYGQTEPPIYNLSQITAPLILHYSENDYLSSVQDVKRLAEELPNAQLKLVPRSKFNHLDYAWATDILELLNNDVISEIKSFT